MNERICYRRLWSNIRYLSAHHFLKDGVEATAAGLKAGVDSDCGGEYQGMH